MQTETLRMRVHNGVDNSLSKEEAMIFYVFKMVDGERKDLFTYETYKRSRQVSCHLDLDPGFDYVILVGLYEAGAEMQFLLRVFYDANAVDGNFASNFSKLNLKNEEHDFALRCLLRYNVDRWVGPWELDYGT